MTRKTSPYARKMRQRGHPIGTVNAAAWHNVIERCQPMGEREPIVTGLQRATDPDTRLIEANDALSQLLNHTAEPTSAAYDCLGCIVDVTHLRALQIAGPNRPNPMHADLHEARKVLRRMHLRWQRLGKWGMAGPDRAVMTKAVEHYETILLASSAQQMHDAETLRREHLAQGHFFTETD